MKVTVTYEILIETIQEIIDEAERVLGENANHNEVTDYVLEALDEYIVPEFNYHHYDDLTVDTIYNMLYEKDKNKE